jgi:ornithine cyclodeaminase/alanine dehydrogenase-like protein (mu-crystallin family)
MLICTNEEVQKILSMEVCLEAIEEAYRDYGLGGAVNIPRADMLTPHPLRDYSYEFKTMSGAVPRYDICALRLSSSVIAWPTVLGTYRKEKIPAAPGSKWLGLIMLFRISNGELLCTLPDGYLQRMRVGATSGIGVKYMARNDAARVGLLGSGFQAGAQLMAVCGVRKIAEIKVFSPNRDHRVAFCVEMERDLAVPVKPVDQPDEVARDVDILITATNSMVSLTRPGWLRPGMHYTSVRPIEVDDGSFKRFDRVIKNSFEAEPLYYPMEGCKTPDVEVGWSVYQRQQFPKLRILAEVVAGRIPGRERAEEITYFMNSVGLGIQFAAVGAKFYELARREGLGREIPTDWFLQTMHT